MINFTTEQKAIFNWFQIGSGNLCVEARAGSAKTTTIIEGLNRANSSSALYAVFNKKNQLEAASKITNEKVTVKTLHSIGYGIILKHWKGVSASSYTEFERIKTLYSDAPKQIIFLTASLVSYLKNVSVGEITKTDATKAMVFKDIDAGKHAAEGWGNDKIIEMALASIQKSKEYPENKKISFDDMVFLPVALGWVKPEYKLVVVDEAQDMSLPQLTMATGLCETNGRVCLIGDSYQAIYAFRGALDDSMSIFSQKLNAKKLALTTSFRCGKRIIELAKTLVPDIKAFENCCEGEITNESFENLAKAAKVKDAVLCRTNAPLMKACLNLIRNKVPAYIEGRDIGYALASIVEGLEAKSMAEFYDRLDSWLAARQAKANTWNGAQQAADATDKAETLKVLAESCLDVKDVVNKIYLLFKDADGVKVPSVVCSTIHKAKGLEWSNVFILNAPSKRVLTPADVSTERNIKYVGITRAKQKLITVNLG